MVKKLPADAEDMGSIPGPGRSPGEGHGNPLQCSCLENPMDRGAWRATVHRVAKSQTRLKQLRLPTLDQMFVLIFRIRLGCSVFYFFLLYYIRFLY